MRPWRFTLGLTVAFWVAGAASIFLWELAWMHRYWDRLMELYFWWLMAAGATHVLLLAALLRWSARWIGIGAAGRSVLRTEREMLAGSGPDTELASSLRDDKAGTYDP